MCDMISLPDGRELHSINGNGDCLCCNTEEEIRKFIAENVSVGVGEVLVIHRDAFGWNVSLKSTNSLNQTTMFDDVETAYHILENMSSHSPYMTEEDRHDFELLKQCVVKIEVRTILDLENK